MKRFASTLLLALIGLSLWAITAQEAVDAYAARKGMRHASAGVVVIDIDSNKVIAGNLQDQAMVTASTMNAVSSPKSSEISLRVCGVSSTTSCNKPASTVAWSCLRSARILATS